MAHKLGEGKGFDWLMTFFATWFTAGIFVEGWVRVKINFPIGDFSAPWNFVLYSGFVACAIALLSLWLANINRGFHWKQALPHHYGLSLVGVLIFALATVFECYWSGWFPVGAGIETLLNPAQILLCAAGALIVGGPFRALLRRTNQGKQGIIKDLPAVLSVTYFMSFFVYIGQHLHPFSSVWPAHQTPDPYLGQALGIGQIIFFTVLLMSLILMLLRRQDLPVGSFTVIMGLHAVSMIMLYGSLQFLLSTLAAGLIIDMLISHAGDQMLQPKVLRLFGFSVPVIFFMLYFVAIEISGGIAWPVHLWTGALLIAGLVGWLMSYLILPPYHEHLQHSKK